MVFQIIDFVHVQLFSYNQVSDNTVLNVALNQEDCTHTFSCLQHSHSMSHQSRKIAHVHCHVCNTVLNVVMNWEDCTHHTLPCLHLKKSGHLPVTLSAPTVQIFWYQVCISHVEKFGRQPGENAKLLASYQFLVCRIYITGVLFVLLPPHCQCNGALWHLIDCCLVVDCCLSLSPHVLNCSVVDVKQQQ